MTSEEYLAIRKDRVKRCKSIYLGIADADLTGSFWWRNDRQSRCPGYYYAGLHQRYKGPTDFTASILELYIDGHQSGDVPRFHLPDVIAAAGDLWDQATVDFVYGLLKDANVSSTIKSEQTPSSDVAN